jgi:hypothetical protein
MFGLLLGNVGNILRYSSGTPWEPDGNTPKTKKKEKIPAPPPPPPQSYAPKKKTWKIKT